MKKMILSIILIGVAIFIVRTKFIPEEKIHKHAGFLVFENNVKRDFSDSTYMYISPCEVDDTHEDTPQQAQLEKAHLHDNVGDVIHIERSGALWKDLFTNIGFPINDSTSTGYINGNKVENFQTKLIEQDDSLVVFIGENDINKYLLLAPTKEYIEEMAKKSTTCE